MSHTLTLKDKKVKIGDTIAIHYKFKEGQKAKDQVFTGILIKVRGNEDNKMFTVRKMTKDNIGVERIFPIISPFIDKVELVKTGKVRRSKLYFVRRLSDSQIRERIMKQK